MTINRKNWFALYYKWCLGYYPKDICSFFWTSLILIILGVLIVPGRYILSSTNIKYEIVMTTIFGGTMYASLFLFIKMGESFLLIFGYKFIYWWSWLFGGFILGAVIFSVFIWIFLLLWYMYSLFKKLSLTKKETHFVENTMDIIGAIKGKYCTKIDWKD